MQDYLKILPPEMMESFAGVKEAIHRHQVQARIFDSTGKYVEEINEDRVKVSEVDALQPVKKGGWQNKGKGKAPVKDVIC